MEKIRKHLKHIFMVVSVILSGVLLTGTLFSFVVNSSVLNAEYHHKLFIRHSVYEHTQNIVNNSMKDFINNFKKSSPQNYEQYKDTFVLLENKLTPEMIRTNLDSLRNGLFQYFKGDKIFLPDIYLNSQSDAGKQSDTRTPSNGNIASQALTRINRINLSVILSYIDRNDIIDRIMVIKLFYYLMEFVPIFSLLLLVLLFILNLFAARSFNAAVRWIISVLLFCGAQGFLGGIGLLIYLYVYLKGIVSLISMSVPLASEVITAYLRDCIYYLSFSLLFIGFGAVAAALLLNYVKRAMPVGWVSRVVGKIPANACKYVKYMAFSLALVALVILLSCEAAAFKKGFDSNDFAAVTAKMRNVSTVTKVISAKDDAIYVLQIKLLDEKTGKPVPHVKMSVTGKSNKRKNEFNETSATDESGIAKFTLDEGSFRLSFNSEDFPVQYRIPSPVLFNLEKAGTTIFTINLGPVPESEKSKWGIVEVEVLDSNNKPVPEVELSVDGVVAAPGYPDKVLSYTNSEGIAVFKINEGNHKIGFTTPKFPQQFVLPSPFEVTVTYNAITRYTVRLVDVKESKTTAPKQPNSLKSTARKR